jgi:hypothetical protein
LLFVIHIDNLLNKKMEDVFPAGSTDGLLNGDFIIVPEDAPAVYESASPLYEEPILPARKRCFNFYIACQVAGSREEKWELSKFGIHLICASQSYQKECKSSGFSVPQDNKLDGTFTRFTTCLFMEHMWQNIPKCLRSLLEHKAFMVIEFSPTGFHPDERLVNKPGGAYSLGTTPIFTHRIPFSKIMCPGNAKDRFIWISPSMADRIADKTTGTAFSWMPNDAAMFMMKNTLVNGLKEWKTWIPQPAGIYPYPMMLPTIKIINTKTETLMENLQKISELSKKLIDVAYNDIAAEVDGLETQEDKMAKLRQFFESGADKTKAYMGRHISAESETNMDKHSLEGFEDDLSRILGLDVEELHKEFSRMNRKQKKGEVVFSEEQVDVLNTIMDIWQSMTENNNADGDSDSTIPPCFPMAFVTIDLFWGLSGKREAATSRNQTYFSRSDLEFTREYVMDDFMEKDEPSSSSSSSLSTDTSGESGSSSPMKSVVFPAHQEKKFKRAQKRLKQAITDRQKSRTNLSVAHSNKVIAQMDVDPMADASILKLLVDNDLIESEDTNSTIKQTHEMLEEYKKVMEVQLKALQKAEEEKEAQRHQDKEAEAEAEVEGGEMEEKNEENEIKKEERRLRFLSIAQKQEEEKKREEAETGEGSEEEEEEEEKIRVGNNLIKKAGLAIINNFIPRLILKAGTLWEVDSGEGIKCVDHVSFMLIITNSAHNAGPNHMVDITLEIDHEKTGSGTIKLSIPWRKIVQNFGIVDKNDGLYVDYELLTGQKSLNANEDDDDEGAVNIKAKSNTMKYGDLVVGSSADVGADGSILTSTSKFFAKPLPDGTREQSSSVQWVSNATATPFIVMLPMSSKDVFDEDIIEERIHERVEEMINKNNPNYKPSDKHYRPASTVDELESELLEEQMRMADNAEMKIVHGLIITIVAHPATISAFHQMNSREASFNRLDSLSFILPIISEHKQE